MTLLRPSCKLKKNPEISETSLLGFHISSFQSRPSCKPKRPKFRHFKNTSSSPSSSTNPKNFSSTLTSSYIASKSTSISSNRFIDHQTIVLTRISGFLTHIVELVRSYRNLTIFQNSGPVFLKCIWNSGNSEFLGLHKI